MLTNDAPVYKEALERLFINHNLDALLESTECNNTNPWFFNFDNETYYCYIRGRYARTMTDCTLTNERRSYIIEQRARHTDWQIDARNKKHRASNRLHNRLTSQDPRINHNARRFATATSNPALHTYRESAREAIHASIKACGDPRRIPNPENFAPDAAPAEIVSSHNAAWAFYQSAYTGYLTAYYGGAAYAIDWGMIETAMVRMHPLFQKIKDAVVRHEERLSRCGDKEWINPVWAGESWYVQTPTRWFHKVHVSEKDPSLVAYTQSGDKLLKDIQTAVKPGRYLSQFFGHVLSEEHIREWAQRQVEASKPVKVHFVPNTDPDGWEWVYEHPHGFSSCMQHAHPNRYLAAGLSGENHPVRTYAHPANSLALAYLGDPVGTDDGRVYARAIVDVDAETYVRIYGDDRLTNALQAAGYSYSGDTLYGQVLHKREFNGEYIMPYLDGNVTNVREGVRGGQAVFVVDEDGDYGAQNSSGLMALEGRCECAECGSRGDEDDMTYVESADGYVCERCIDRYYVYAYLRRGQEWCRQDNCIRCESDGEWYHTGYTEYHSIGQCEATDEYYFLDDLVLCEYGDYAGQYIHCDLAKELPDGEYCHERDYDDVIAEHFAEEEEEETAPPAPALPEGVICMSMDAVASGALEQLIGA